MSALHKQFIITDSFYPKKLSKYECHTLSNINVKCNEDNKMFVFLNKTRAQRYLSISDEQKKYVIKSVDDEEVRMICKCFDLLPIYVS